MRTIRGRNACEAVRKGVKGGRERKIAMDVWVAIIL
jgi:hypothetical protein